MISKFETIGIGISIVLMALALYLIRLETNLLTTAPAGTQTAAVINNPVVVGQAANVNQARVNALLEASDSRGNINRMVINDIVVGTGAEVKTGDTVRVHYIGTLQDGFEFDNSLKRGEAFTFTVGEGRVIQGWEQGIIGMKVGGQRVLVIPSDLAYGSQAIGPIPAYSTLVFAIELLSIN